MEGGKESSEKEEESGRGSDAQRCVRIAVSTQR